MQLVFPSLLAFVAFVAAQADPSINTPAAVVQCQPAQISFVASKTPVFISIIPGGQPSAAPLQDLGQQNASPFTWNANIPSGTSITFQIRDSTGAVAYSAPITIQDSSDSSCLGAGASSSAAGSSSGTAPAETTSAAATSSAAATTSAAVSSASSVSTSIEASTSSVIASVSSSIASVTRPTSTAPSTSRSASATSASASASSSPNAARGNAQVGFAGLLGLVAAAFMA